VWVGKLRIARWCSVSRVLKTASPSVVHLRDRGLGGNGKTLTNVVAAGVKRLYDRLRKVLIGEEAHLGWNREHPVFVGEILPSAFGPINQIRRRAKLSRR
jgi:hypothetical protein